MRKWKCGNGIKLQENIIIGIGKGGQRAYFLDYSYLADIGSQFLLHSLLSGFPDELTSGFLCHCRGRSGSGVKVRLKKNFGGLHTH